MSTYSDTGYTSFDSIQLKGRPTTIGAYSFDVLLYDSAGLIVMASGTTVPASVAGFAIGAIFQHTDGTAGAVNYVNEGTSTSCTFVSSTLGTGSVVGLNVARKAIGHYKFADDGGGVGSIGLGATLPDNAIITGATIDVITGLTSGGSATVAIGVPTDDPDCIMAATAFNNAALAQGVRNVTLNAVAKTSAARELSIVVATAALTAGEFYVIVDYVVTA